MPLRGTFPAAARYFTSGMRRAVETLTLLYGDVPHTDIPDLAECGFGAFENRSHEDLVENEPLYRVWLAGDRETAFPGGESRATFEARVGRGYHTLVSHPWEGLAVLVSHGGVLVTLMALLGCGNGGLMDTPLNACGWVLRLSEAGRAVHYEAYP